MPCAILRPARHWGSSASWRGAPECAPAPDCPQPAWRGPGQQQHSPVLEDWHRGRGLLLRNPLSAAGDFHRSAPRPQSHLQSPRRIPFPRLRTRRQSLLRMEHWSFLSPLVPQNPLVPLPSQPQREGQGSPPLRSGSGHPAPQNRPLTSCPDGWEGPQPVLPLRLGVGLGREEQGGWDCGRAVQGPRLFPAAPLCGAKSSPPAPCKPQPGKAWSPRPLSGLRLSLHPNFFPLSVSGLHPSPGLVPAPSLPLQTRPLPLSLLNTLPYGACLTPPLLWGQGLCPHPQLFLRGCPCLVTPHSSRAELTRASCLW